MNFLALPKIELHLHLDCCLSFEIVQQLNPGISYHDWYQSFVAPPKCTDLADYITRAIKGIELMQTKEQLRLVTLDLLRQLKADNVIYAEIRFAPLQHLAHGLSPADVVDAVNYAIIEGNAMYEIETRIILCTLRHYSSDQSMQTIRLVEQFKNTMVVGFDIAADEAGYPIDEHIAAFEFAKKSGICCTAHAGEAKGSDSIRETLAYLKPTRIGHGVRCIEDAAIMNQLKEQDIHLEVCASSNIQVDVFPTIQDHPIDAIYKSGISMSVNTDARTITPVTLSAEYEMLQREFDWKLSHFLKCNLEAVRHAFISNEVKTVLSAKIKSAYQQMENISPI
ncbi:MAG: adenosine deaminase [Chitinophagaceae bacterium]|nr:adenosine deaminase [Chitinophagaceae bacterium]